MSRAAAAELATALERRGWHAEVFLKRGRSRRFELGPQGRLAAFSDEAGWAVRAGDDRGSFFAAGSGEPPAEGPWPAPDGRPLDFPPARPVPGWRPPADLDASLAVESEAVALLEAVERELVRELPGARLLCGVAEEGTSECELASTRQVRAGYRSRAASLLLEAAGPTGTAATALLAERELRRFQPSHLARSLATRLHVLAEGRPPERDRGEMLLAPPVAARLLAGLRPLLLGPDAPRRAGALRDRSGRLGSGPLTLIDDGRLAGGVLAAPVDGEGMPTRELVLVEEGVYRQPLLSWRESAAGNGRATGCVRRPGWRDLPRPGFSHLYLRRDPAVAPGALLGSVARGYYLIDANGGGAFDLTEDRFRLPVCGFRVRQGQAAGPVADAWLCGAVSAFLRGLQAVARDLVFHPLDGMIGAPSLLVGGLELRPAS